VPTLAALKSSDIAAFTTPAAVPGLIGILARADRQTVVDQVLPVRGALSPTGVMTLLGTGVAAAELALILGTAHELGQTDGAVNTYLTGAAAPRRTNTAYRTSVIDQKAARATAAPVNVGTGTATSGATFTLWQQHAEIDGPTLDLLLAEGRVRTKWLAPFQTVEEQASGGDTQEYEIRIRTAEGAWATRWVAHAHREPKMAWNKTSINHIKHWEQRKHKQAERIPISADTMAAVRDAAVS
jgi:hypothetical protein